MWDGIRHLGSIRKSTDWRLLYDSTQDISNRTMTDIDTLVTLESPPILTAGEFDRSVIEIRDQIDDADNLLVDLSEATFIEVAALTAVLSTLISRCNDRRHTQFRLPKSKKVRDFLRTWEFSKAVIQATGTPFYQFVHEEDQAYFGENADVTENKYAGIVLFGGQKFERLLSTRFFGFTVFRRKAERFRAKLAVDVASRWKQDIITTVLENVLDGSGDIFASRIVFEALLNSVRHPDAKTIVLASHCDGYSKANTVTLCVWDDGSTIAQTLRTTLDARNPVSTSNGHDTFNLKYEVKSAAGKEIYTSGFVPTAEHTDEMLLFSSLLPGISSALQPGTPVGAPSPDPDVYKNPQLSKPGMGLFLLLNAAVEIFGGSVAIRSGSVFLNAKRHRNPSKADYAIKVADDLPSFPGNLLTIRLPRKGGS